MCWFKFQFELPNENSIRLIRGNYSSLKWLFTEGFQSAECFLRSVFRTPLPNAPPPPPQPLLRYCLLRKIHFSLRSSHTPSSAQI